MLCDRYKLAASMNVAFTPTINAGLGISLYGCCF